MKYLLLAGDNYKGWEGWNDVWASASSIEELKETAASLMPSGLKDCDEYQIVDLERTSKTGRPGLIVEEGVINLGILVPSKPLAD